MINMFSWSRRRVIGLLLTAGVAISLSACRSSDPQQTATAFYDEALANIETLRTTATVVRARIQTTLDHAGTRVVQAEAAGTFLASNLISLGTDAAYIVEGLAQVNEIAAPARQTPPANQAAPSSPAGSPQPTQSPRTIVTPPVVTPPPSPTGSGPRLENITMASGVNEFDCAIDASPRFTPASTAIYVVGRAYGIPAGATISSSWQRSGTEIVSFSFHREHDINDNCIWFYIDQTDTPFTVGSWSVEISVDGAPLASPVAFQIVAN